VTSTGRASIAIGAVLFGTFINSALDRNAADVRAQADRETYAEINARKRAYQNFQDSRKSYESSYQKHGEKPQCDEDNWKDWSKTKLFLYN
jgi:chitodextrinase